MGTYHPNADAVIQGDIGERLADRGNTYADYFTQLRGQQLWLATHNGGWSSVLLIDSAEAFDDVFPVPEHKVFLGFYAIAGAYT